MLRCILCGAPFTSDIEDPADGERHDTLTCAAHSDEQLRRRGLDALWGGEDRETSPAFFTGRRARIVGAWDHPPCIATYVLLDDGDLLMFVTWGGPQVLVARVPRSERVLAVPEGFLPCRREPWPTAIREVSSTLCGRYSTAACRPSFPAGAISCSPPTSLAGANSATAATF